mmetsp:Transcript_58798/g.164158  ORF Transcript_58798/g.164158 Transcript_58798/m.164158 type:complete len:206 (-) Transcript_58798:452-1069(-)
MVPRVERAGVSPSGCASVPPIAIRRSSAHQQGVGPIGGVPFVLVRVGRHVRTADLPGGHARKHPIGLSGRRPFRAARAVPRGLFTAHHHPPQFAPGAGAIAGAPCWPYTARPYHLDVPGVARSSGDTMPQRLQYRVPNVRFRPGRLGVSGPSPRDRRAPLARPRGGSSERPRLVQAPVAFIAACVTSAQPTPWPRVPEAAQSRRT